MSVLDLYSDATMAAAPRVMAQPRPEPRFSAWSAIPRGIGEAGLQVGATAADLWQSFKTMRDATPEQRRQMHVQGAPVDSYSSQTGDWLRDMGRRLRPDPVDASEAESIMYGFARGLSKVAAGAAIAGPWGILAAGAEEAFTQSDELRRQGVGIDARGKAGLVQGAGLALAALPVAGQGLASTAALYMAGGPGGMIAQQALTRDILQRAGHADIAQQFDPFDPVGLALSALIPAPFAALGLRNARRTAAARDAEAFRAGPVPSERTPVAAAVAEAGGPVPRDAMDAAMVLHQAERRTAAHIGEAGHKAEAAHETAIAKAEAQIARGDPVNVAEDAPRIITGAERDANLAAWFGDSKVVDAEGKPLVVYHGTNADFTQFSAGDGMLGKGIYFTPNAAGAPMYPKLQNMRAQREGREPGPVSVLPVYVSLRNPLVLNDLPASKVDAGRVAAQGYDGIILLNPDGTTKELTAFRPEQIKSAIGNSGRFDPNSPSLTDPLADFAAGLRALQDARADAPTTAQAPNPEAPTAARSAGQPADSAVADAGRPAAEVQTAGMTPGAQAEATAATGRLAQIQAERPDMLVMMDGMDKPQRLSDFLAAVQAEADEMKADAPLLQVAAECALLNGR